MTNSDRNYRTFEEFERAELQRFEAAGASVDQMLDAIFGEESDDRSSGQRVWGQEEED